MISKSFTQHKFHHVWWCDKIFRIENEKRIDDICERRHQKQILHQYEILTWFDINISKIHQRRFRETNIQIQSKNNFEWRNRFFFRQFMNFKRFFSQSLIKSTLFHYRRRVEVFRNKIIRKMNDITKQRY